MIRFKLRNIGLFIVWVLLTLLSILVGAVYLLFGARGDPMNVLISQDQTWNTIFDGLPDETISARSYRQKMNGECWGCFMVGLIDWIFYPGHCRLAFMSEATRTQLPATYTGDME